MCACIAQPRSGLAPMIPTRILFDPFLRIAMTSSDLYERKCSLPHLPPAPKHYATLTTVFPKFSPVKMPLKAVGTCSTPSTMCILNFMLDRKSTRLNSSHSQISYAVFCLKKKLHQGGVLNAPPPPKADSAPPPPPCHTTAVPPPSDRDSPEVTARHGVPSFVDCHPRTPFV